MGEDVDRIYNSIKFIHTLKNKILRGCYSTSCQNKSHTDDPLGTHSFMNGEQLVTLLMEYNIGVRRMSHDLFELEELPIEKGDI